ncbi:MAG: group II intron reverse transcriptase/maturase [bacterium]
MREKREIPNLPTGQQQVGRVGKALGRTPAVNGSGKSDSSVVPAKSPNKAGTLAAEVVEGRGLAKENADRQNGPRTQSRISAPSALERVRQAAKKDRNARFTALFQHITLDSLFAAFDGLKRRAAAGVDGMTWAQYREGLEGNLRDLHGRLQRGAYRAKPSRRTYIPKADGRQRPLGIAALEDKIVQRAAVEVLNAIYEGDFLGFSYGFRPGRNQHQALDALAIGIERKKVGWVLDADIRSFFDTIDHGWLMKFVEHRVADRRVLRLIQKWLSAGVMEDGKWTATEEGTPQGATVSPLLANIFLHYVYDLWVQSWRKKHARGDMIAIRYADDTVVGFQHRDDAERFQKDLQDRVRKFGLELHPEKTRLIRFGRFAAAQNRERGLGKPETFDFLGLTHICSRSRGGKFQLRRQTVRKRMNAKLHEVKMELRRKRHQSIAEQGTWLAGVLRGYFAYHAVPTNGAKMQQFRTQVTRHWRRSLQRRSQRGRINWERMGRIAARWLPPARTQHPWPNQRFDARIQGKSPVR